jgi:hypothetical protein
MTARAAATAHDIFVQAYRFESAAGVLVRHESRTLTSGAGTIRIKTPDGATVTTVKQASHNFPLTSIPAFVCEAFCVELYLKTVYRLANAEYGFVHPLDVLFDGLSAEWRDRIAVSFSYVLSGPLFAEMRSSPNCPIEIRACLSQAADAFQRWRYMFEFGPRNDHFLAPARIAIRRSILAVRPEWNPSRRALNVPPKPQTH